MIVDKIANLAKYKALIPHVEIIVKHLSIIEIEKMASGKYDIPGTNLFYYCFVYKTSPFEDCKGEAHLQFVDIHLIVQGRETVGVLDGSIDQIGSYNAQTDFSSATGTFRTCLISKGDFVVFFQHEGHITSAHAKPAETEAVKRLVFKIPMHLG